jgi:hypothetical protein
MGVMDMTEGVIFDANGEPATRPTQILTSEEAALLRLYKKFLHSHGLREILHCNTCFSGNLADGMRAHVTDNQIMWECRHRLLFYQGSSY